MTEAPTTVAVLASAWMKLDAPNRAIMLKALKSLADDVPTDQVWADFEAAVSARRQCGVTIS